MGAKFTIFNGELNGLTTNDNHLVFKWNKAGCKVLFSMAQHGGAASCHFSSDSDGLRHLRQAITEFVTFVFESFVWCRMIIANVELPSVGRLISKLDFVPFATYDKGTSYMRVK